MKRMRHAIVLAAAFGLAPSCGLTGEGASASFGSQGGSGGGTGVGGSSGTTGPDVCDYNPEGDCTVPADCCVNVPRVPGVASSDAPGCPGPNAYPNNWDCDNNGSCVNLGCDNNADCVLDGFTCEETKEATGNGVKHCVHTCTLDSHCINAARMPGTKCIGDIESGGQYCLEDL